MLSAVWRISAIEEKIRSSGAIPERLVQILQGVVRWQFVIVTSIVSVNLWVRFLCFNDVSIQRIGGIMPPTIGAPAPEFTLKDQDQKEVKLSDYKGKKRAEIVFYPLDWSPTCTKEHACLVSDAQQFAQLDAHGLDLSVELRRLLRISHQA